MITDVILNNAQQQPDKIAIWYDNQFVSYRELAEKIQYAALFLESTGKYFIDSASPIQAVATLLACQLSGSLGLITHADITSFEKEQLAEQVGFCDLPTTKVLKNNNSDIQQNDFLGVLTSGSTGIPKIIAKDNACWERAFSHQSTVFGISSSDKILVLDALAYSANLNAVLHGLWVGASIRLCSLKKARRWGEVIVSEGITSIFMVPSHLKLLQDFVVPSEVRSIVTAGEKLSGELADAILRNFPQVQLTEYYGTAELGHIAYHQNKDIIANPISVGGAFPEVKITIRENQLFVESPYVSPAYRKVNTVGDLGQWQAGKLVLLGRGGKMFSRRGLNIYAQEIEQKALSFRGVEEVNLQEISSGQSPRLVLFFSTNRHFVSSSNRTEALMCYLRAILPQSKWPNRAVEVAVFPRLPHGKVNEKGLKLLLDYADEALNV